MILVLRFLPSIHRTYSTSPPPPLELHLEADHREIKRIIALRAITSSFTSDALLPVAPVDARFSQQRYFTLSGSDVHQHAPSVLDFLSTATLQPWNGKFATPPKLSGLSLPRRLYADALLPTDEGGPENVEYLFVGLEVRRAVTTDYEGFKLGYRSVEAGQRGKTTELFLEAVPVSVEDAASADPARPSASRPYSAESFTRTVARLANKRYFWQRNRS